MSTLCVCIPTYNRPHMIERLLDNLALQKRLPDEILIIDASPNPDTKRVVARHESRFPPRVVRYIRSEKGLTRQRNAAIGSTQADLIFMLDDDVLLENDCIQVMEEFMDSETGQAFGGVSAYITNDYGKPFYGIEQLYHRVGIYERLEPGRWLYNGAFLELSKLTPFSGIYPADFLPGCAMMFRRNVLLKISPDSNFPYGGGEDKHLTLRISYKYKLGVLGTARLRHDHDPGGARRNPFYHGVISTRTQAVMLSECDPNPTRKRYMTYLVYKFVDLLVGMVATVVYRKFQRRHLVRLAGSWVGWWWNVFARPSRKRLDESN